MNYSHSYDMCIKLVYLNPYLRLFPPTAEPSSKILIYLNNVHNEEQDDPKPVLNYTGLLHCLPAHVIQCRYSDKLKQSMRNRIGYSL